MMSAPKFSIASVTYRNLEQTKQFIESVYNTVSGQPFEFIMVNNGCDKPLSDYLQEQERTRENFKVAVNKSNMGIGPAMSRAMKACSTDYIFRADSDVVMLSSDWDEEMMRYVDKFSEIGAVGTANTGGNFIPRKGAAISADRTYISENAGYIETDICMSSFMLIPRRTIDTISKRMRDELPRIQKIVVDSVMSSKNSYDGYQRHLGGILNYMLNHAGYWNAEIFYGADDFWYSMMIRYCGLRIAKAPSVKVFHKDESMRPDWTTDRDKYVSEGFQIHRLTWEIFQDFNKVVDMWDCFPLNSYYRSEDYRRLL